MWIYLARPDILIPGGLRLITPCPSPLLGRRAVIDILRSESREPDCKSLRFTHTLVLTIGSTIGLLVGCSGGQFAQYWSGS